MSKVSAKRLSKADAWALAATGIMVNRGNYNFDGLLVEESNEHVRTLLESWWGVQDAESAKEWAEWLFKVGNRREYAQIVDHLTTGTALEEDPENQASPEWLAFVGRHMVHPWGKDLLGWDLSRLGLMVRLAYTAGYMDESTAWNYIRESARKLQRAYNSWEELLENHCLGWKLANNGKDLPRVDGYLNDALMLDPERLWKRLEWNTNLSEGGNIELDGDWRKSKPAGTIAALTTPRFISFRPSRKGWINCLTTAACGLAAGLLLSLLYAYACVWGSGTGFRTIMMSIIYVATLGMSLGGIAILLKCRAIWGLLWGGMLLAAPILYFEYATFTYAYLQKTEALESGETLATILGRPAMIWECMTSTAETGRNSIHGWTPKGGMVWGARILEALFVIISCGGAPFGLTCERAFCEECKAWRKRRKGVLYLEYDEESDTHERLEEGEFALLDELEVQEGGRLPAICIDVLDCPKCAGDYVIEVGRAKMGMGRKGPKRVFDSYGGLMWASKAWLDEMMRRRGR